MSSQDRATSNTGARFHSYFPRNSGENWNIPSTISPETWINFFYYFKWLVKHSLEFRQEIASSVRKYAVTQFEKAFELENTNADQQRKVSDNINLVKQAYLPHRYFKRKNVPPHDITSRVQITLLEYDYRGASRACHSGPEKDSRNVGSAVEDDEFQEVRLNMCIVSCIFIFTVLICWCTLLEVYWKCSVFLQEWSDY